MADTSIYEAMGRNLGDVLTKGIPTGCTATTLDSNSLIYPLTDQLKGKEVYIYEGEGEGQARTISAYTSYAVPTGGRITVNPPFTTIPTANSRFLLFDHFKVEDYENAMNRYIGITRLLHLNEKVATMALAATQYEYAVPSGFEYINNLRLVPSSHTDYAEDDEVARVFELPQRYWRIESNASGTYVIAFDARKINLDDFDDEWVNIMGQAKPDFSAASMAEDVQEYIIAGASMLLASQRIAENMEWRLKFGMFKQMKDELEVHMFTYRRGKRVG